MIELAIIPAVLLYLAWRDRQTARLLETASPDLTQLVALVDRLCQRVQAPDVAVTQHAAQGGEQWAPPAIGFDDDEAFMQSKEDLALMLAQGKVT